MTAGWYFDGRKDLFWPQFSVAWRLAESELEGPQARQFAPGWRGTMKDTNGVKGQWLSG